MGNVVPLTPGQTRVRTSWARSECEAAHGPRGLAPILNVADQTRLRHLLVMLQIINRRLTQPDPTS